MVAVVKGAWGDYKAGLHRLLWPMAGLELVL